MTTNNDLGRRLSRHFRSEAPSRAPSWLLEVAFAEIETTHQRRGLRARPWRSPNLMTFMRPALVAGVLIAIGGVWVVLSRPGPSVGGPEPLPVESPASQTVAPSPTRIGTATLSATGCDWQSSLEATSALDADPPGPLPAGPIEIAYQNTADDDGEFVLFLVNASGTTYQDLAASLNGMNAKAVAGEDPGAFPRDASPVAGGRPGPREAGVLTTTTASGAVYGLSCARGYRDVDDHDRDVYFNFYPVGPFEFE